MTKPVDDSRSQEFCRQQVHYLECLDRVNRVIHQSDDAEQMLWTVLQEVQDMFGSDRIWLFYPCDPQSPTYRIPIEIARPEYPGAHALNLDVPMKPGGDLICAKALAANGPVYFDAATDPPIFPELTAQFGVRSQMAVAIHPRIGNPWLFGMHQCAYLRRWTEDERKLFDGIARRIGEGLSTLLLLRDLRESQERFDLAVQGSRDGLWDWPDTAQEKLWWSPRTFELFGFAPHEIAPTLTIFLQHVHAEDLPRIRDQIDLHLQMAQDPIDEQFRIVGKDGQERWVRLRGMSLQDERGRVRRISGSLQDMSAEKRTELELEGYRNHLETLVEERTHKLLQANAELAEANQELEAFTYSVSHDLRTPLAPIIGFAELLDLRYADKLDERARGMLAEIIAQGEKMICLIDDLLSLARVGHLKGVDKLVHAEEILAEVLSDLSGEFPDVQRRVRLLSNLPVVHIHPTLLSQLFTNLIGNALRYAGADSQPVEVSGERQGVRVRFVVSDHGVGIPQDEQSQVFGAFFRGAAGKKIRGTGVGLAIVSKIAHHYGGRAWLEDTPGGGCTFLVELFDGDLGTEVLHER